MKRLVIDLDGTIAVAQEGNYRNATVVTSVRDRLLACRNEGYGIAVYTSRNMRTYGGNIGMINANTLPAIVEWLDRHKVPYDEIIVGKPWCGEQGFYVDDRTVRPDEFVSKSDDEIRLLLAESSRRLQKA